MPSGSASLPCRGQRRRSPRQCRRRGEPPLPLESLHTVEAEQSRWQPREFLPQFSPHHNCALSCCILLVDKNILNGGVKIACEFESQNNGRVVSSVFQRPDGLPGNLQGSGQLFLADAMAFSQCFQSIFQERPPFLNVK